MTDHFQSERWNHRGAARANRVRRRFVFGFSLGLDSLYNL
jgi:hypothetical protein